MFVDEFGFPKKGKLVNLILYRKIGINKFLLEMIRLRSLRYLVLSKLNNSILKIKVYIKLMILSKLFF